MSEKWKSALTSMDWLRGKRWALCTRSTHILASSEGSSFSTKRVTPYWHCSGQLILSVRDLVNSVLSCVSERQKTRLVEISSIHRRLVARRLASLDVDLIQLGIDALATVFAAVRQTHEEIAVRPYAVSDVSDIIDGEIENICEAYDEASCAFLALRQQLQRPSRGANTHKGTFLPHGSGLNSSSSELPKMSLPKFS
ncbi:hypothetical protein M0804_014356 [Polistes exclamans]|nr:hypothetical protein M0804_014356 [Polistes exclamans]